jgi:hypothetical protein
MRRLPGRLWVTLWPPRDAWNGCGPQQLSLPLDCSDVDIPSTYLSSPPRWVYYGQPLPYSVVGSSYDGTHDPSNPAEWDFWQIEFKCSPYCGQLSFGFAIAVFYPKTVYINGRATHYRMDAYLGGFEGAPPWVTQVCDPLEASGNYALILGANGVGSGPIVRCGEMTWPFLVTE